jgi:hypothetical protein
MRKFAVKLLVGLVVLVIAFLFFGTAAVLAFFALFCVVGTIVLIAKYYPSDRALEDQHDREDNF